MYGGQVLEVNATGVLFTAQAAGRQMARFGRGGSIILIASVSGSITNRVSRERKFASVTDNGAGSRVCAVQHVQVCDAADGTKHGVRAWWTGYSGEHALTWLHLHTVSVSMWLCVGWD